MVAILAIAPNPNQGTTTSVSHWSLLADWNSAIPTLIADRFNVVEGPLWRAPLAATFSCFTAAPQPAHAALTTFSVASAEDVRQAVEGFVAAFVELVEHNVLAAIAVRNSNLVELDS